MFNFLDRAHITLDFLDEIEVMCQKKIESAENDIQHIKGKQIELLNGRSVSNLNDLENEEHLNYCEQIERLRFISNFSKEILESAGQTYVSALKDTWGPRF